MDFSKLTVTATGTSALLMHSTRGMDKTDPTVKELRSFTKKHASKKTDEDEIEIQRLEFSLAIYHNGERPVVPSDMMFAAIRDGAKAMRLGSEVTRSVIMLEQELPLKFTGPKSVAGLWENKRFVDSRTVKVGQSRVLRTRPKFEEWSVDFNVQFDPDHLDEDSLKRAIINAGTRVGIGDYRPRYGRFSVEFS